MVTSKPTKSRLERQKRSIQKAHPYDGSTKISEIKSIVRQHRRELELEDQSMSAAKFYVPTLPGMPEGVSLTMYAGEVPSSPKGEEGSPHLFFFFMRNKHVAGRPKLLLWFNGGPGTFLSPPVWPCSLSSSEHPIN
jgi:carboxypeptidase C (cathepsin A)